MVSRRAQTHLLTYVVVVATGVALAADVFR